MSLATMPQSLGSLIFLPLTYLAFVFGVNHSKHTKPHTEKKRKNPKKNIYYLKTSN